MANNFLVFDENNENVITDVEYQSHTQRIGGVLPGQALSNLHNKLYRQTSIMSSAIGDFISNNGFDASDTDKVALTSSLQGAIDARIDTKQTVSTKVDEYNITLMANNWVGSPVQSGYSNAIQVQNIPATPKGFLVVTLQDLYSTYPPVANNNYVAISNEFSKITRSCVISAGNVTFYCYIAPTLDIPVSIYNIYEV